jgi:ABC-2 type transport system permease protein
VIWASFRSEWIKIRRPSLLVSTFVGLATAASLFVVLLFAQAPARPQTNGLPTLHQLAQPNGLVHGLSQAAVLLGIVAFGIAASQTASEFGLGTLRQLLVRLPRRTRLLSGKWAATLSFLLLALLFASVVALVVAIVAAHGRQVPTGAWFSGAGIGDLARALLDLELALIGFASLGFAVGLLLRSSVFAVIIGFAWLLPIEAVISRIVPNAEQWLPGSSLQIVAKGGTTTTSFGLALAVSAAYVAVALCVSFVHFRRSDITA